MARNKIIPAIIALSIVFLSLGGVGGSLQPSRILLAATFPILLIRVLNSFYRGEFINLRGLRFSSLLFAFSIFSLGFLSILWTVDLQKTISFLAVLFINLIPIALICVINDDELAFLKKLIPASWLISSILCVVLSIYELLTGNHFYLSLQERGGGEVINALPFAAGFHGNFNDFSLFLFYCLTGILLSQSNDLDLKNNFSNNFFRFFIIFSIVFIVVVNGSRGAIIAVSFVVFYYFLRSYGLRFVFYFMPFCLAFYMLFKPLRDYVELLFYFLIFKFSDFSNDLESSEGRMALLSAGISGVNDSYGLGVGAGASTTFFSSQALVSIPNPHNLLLEWLLNFGFLGLFILLSFLLKVVINSFTGSTGRSRFVVQGFILSLPIWGLVQSHLIGFTYFWLILFSCLITVIKFRNQ